MITFPSLLNIFSSCQRLDFRVSAGVRALVVMDFTAASGGEAVRVWEEEYEVVGGGFSLWDVGDLLRPVLRESLMGQLTVRVTEYSVQGDEVSNGSATYHCQWCEADVVEELLADGFLTLLTGQKQTFMGAREDVYWWRQEGRVAAEVRATYLDEDGEVNVVDYDEDSGRVAVSHSGLPVPNLYKIDLSPRRYEDPLIGTLVRLQLTMGTGENRCMRSYEVKAGEPTGRYMFRNSLGVPETMYCFGTLSEEVKYERRTARIGGMLRNYKIEEERTFTIDTGVMTDEMARWAEELLRSEEVYVLGHDNQIFKEITVTDSKAVRVSDGDALTRYQIDYQYAQRVQNVYGRDDLAARIFDETFDNSFE